jgi:hypothetical protein
MGPKRSLRSGLGAMLRDLYAGTRRADGARSGPARTACAFARPAGRASQVIRKVALHFNIVTDTDRLFLFTLESARPDQIEDMLALAKKKNQPLAEWVADAMRCQLANLSWSERQAFVAEFKAGGIDLENL